MCVASSIAAVVRGDAAQAAFDRKLSLYRNEIGDSRQQGLQSSCVDGGRTSASSCHSNTLVRIASSRNGQQMSAKSLHRRWKHEIQIPLLRRRAAMARRSPAGSFQRGQSGSSQVSSTELCILGDTSPHSTAGPATTTSMTLRLTQQYLTMTMTLSPWRATRTNLCGHRVSDCPICPPCERRCCRPATAPTQ